jgi:hypothetical protein
MPEIRTTQELLHVIGSAAATADPIAELKRRGFTFSAPMLAAIARTRPNVRMGPVARQRMERVARKTRITLRAGGAAAPVAAARFAPDDFDVIAAVTTALADQVLNGLLRTNTLPQVVPLVRLLTAAQRGQLATALTGVFTNIPPDSLAGNLSIRGPLSTRALTGTDGLLLAAPFTLQIVQRTGLPTVVGELRGTLTLVVQLGADVQFLGNPAVAAIRITAQLPAFPSQGAPALVIDATSPIQPQRPEQLPQLARLLQTVLSGIISKSFEVSPFINVPGVPGLRLVVERVDVRSVRAPDGDRIAVGIRFIGAGQTPPDLGRLERLRPEAGRNLALRVHERHFDAALETARRNGALDAIARKENDDARITSADARFSGNKIILTFKGKVVDACLALDVGFTVTQTLALFLDGDQLRVESTTDPDVDDVDQVLCAVIALVAGVAVSLPALLVAPFIGVFQVVLIVAGLLDFPDPSSSTTLIQLDRPIPGTELLPVLERLSARVEDGVLIASAAASLRADDINTYVYVRFLNSLNRFDPGVPLSGARVEVHDRDAPPPPGDDVVLPRTGETERIVGTKFIRTVTVTYEPPTTDPLLGQATTDFDGRAMFALTPAQMRNGAGHVVTTTTIEDLRTGNVESQSTRRTVAERAADVYFKVFAMGDQADTLSKPGGLTVNLQSKHLGTPGVPLQFAVRLTPGATPVFV